MDYFFAAIALGFLGSFHCVGMCGPIALALPVHNKPPLLKFILIILYNLGRILTYALFGLVAGIVGNSLAMAGFQQALSVTIGLVLLTSVVFSVKNNLSGYGFFIWIKSKLSHLFSKDTKPSLFIIGLLNGFLPCGLVYAGIAAATATADLLKGTLFMTFFGIGTVPLMFAIPLIGGSISLSFRNAIRKTTPIIITVMALVLILRGLNLGIPYLSPQISEEEVNCCHKNNPQKRQIIKCHKLTPEQNKLGYIKPSN